MPDWRDIVRNADCELCDLCHAAQFVCLMGSGPEDADVMIVGEAPGAREDEQHKAFVGRSGKLLNRALDELADIDREDCYVTNTAKCRPEDNDTPTNKQAKTCSTEYLLPEIAHVKPKVILALGNVALRALTGKSGILKHHGSVFKRTFMGHDCQVLATVHPAGVLRNPKWVEMFAADIERLGQMLRGEAHGPQTRVFVANTKRQLQTMIRYLKRFGTIAYDIETFTEPGDPPLVRTNLQDWHGDSSTLVSVSFTGQVGVSVVVPLNHPEARVPYDDALRYLERAFSMEGVTWVAHNGKFDARFLASHGINVRQGFDTMLAAHMVDENQRKSLKDLSKNILGDPGYATDVDLKDARQIPLRELAIYNGKDTDYTLRLAHHFHAELKKEPEGQRRIYSQLMMPASNTFVDIERHGVWLDMERWEERHQHAIEVRDLIEEYINRWVPDDLRPINLNSPQQVARLLFEELGLPIIYRTPKGKPSTAEGVLLRIADQHKVATAMIKYRKWAKYLNTYLEPWKYEWKDGEDRLHCFYKLFGTVTGRLSGEGGIQQVPRDPFIRSLIGAPPGRKFLQADYSQIELRIACMMADERRMMDQYIRGEDIHMIRACRMTGKTADQVEKEERKKAKSVNFGFIYGMGVSKFLEYAFDNYGIVMDEAEATVVREGFFNDYPALRPWHQKQRRLAQKYHRVRSPLGRIRHLPDILSDDKKVRAECERQAINSPVQSMASDMMLHSLVRLHRELDPGVASVLGTVHDSILFEVDDDSVDEVAAHVKRVMEDIDDIHATFGLEITVPVIADIEVGQHWGEGEEWHG